MNVERDKFLTEAMGECWHVFKHSCGCCDGYCKKCGVDGRRETDMPYYGDWEGFGKLWEWAQKQRWWEDLCKTLEGWSTGHYDLLLLIRPDRFADVVYKFLKEREVV